MKRACLFLLLLWCSWLSADEVVPVCYGYGCLVQSEVVIDEVSWREVAGMLRLAVDPVDERKILAQVMGRLYRWAGEQTPIHNDRGGNYADENVSGAMDCIDHSTSTSRFLLVLERRGLLHWHRVLPPEGRDRFYIFAHFSAVIEEKTVVPDGVSPRFAVDSWFVDNGEPAVILPLEDWKNGAGPDV